MSNFSFVFALIKPSNSLVESVERATAFNIDHGNAFEIYSRSRAKTLCFLGYGISEISSMFAVG